MNDLQKLASNLAEALKPLNDAINQMCAIAQKPVFQIPPDLFKDINFQGAAGSAGALKSGLASTSLKMMKDKDILSEEFENTVEKLFPHRIIKPAPLAQYSGKMFGMWEPTQHNINPETTLAELRPGAVFVTDNNVYAVKSEYRTDDQSQCECILLASGEYAWFKNGDKTLVREVSVEGFVADDDGRAYDNNKAGSPGKIYDDQGVWLGDE